MPNPTLTDMLAAPPEPIIQTGALSPEPPPLQTPPPGPSDEFAAAGWEKVTPAPTDEFSAAGWEKVGSDEFATAGWKKADALDLKTIEELSADRNKFNPKEYYASNPDVASDPAKLAKLLAVYRQRDKEGLDPGQVAKAAVTETLPTLGKVLGGARDLAAGAINIGVQPAVNFLGSLVTGDIFNKQMRGEMLVEGGKDLKKAFSESAAAAELSASGMADLARTGVRKLASRGSQNPLDLGLIGGPETTQLITGKTPLEKTDQELLRQLSSDVEFGKQMEEVAKGGGEVMKAVGLDAETLATEGVTLDPAVIERLSLVDPLTLVAGAGVFNGVTKAGQVAFSAATRAAAEGMLTKLGQLAARAATSPIRGAGQTARGVGWLTQKAAPYVPLAGITGPGVQKLTSLAGRGISATGRGTVRLGEALAESATLQKALRGGIEGGVAAAPVAALAEDDKTAGALFGAGIGLGGSIRGLIGAAEAPASLVSKSRLAPAEINFPRTNSKPYGLNENLDAAHKQAIRELPQADQNTINAFREATRDLGGEVYVLSPEVFQQTLLENAERTTGRPLTAPELTRLQDLAGAQGFFDVTVPAEAGQTRRVVFLNNAAEPVTHEAGHLFHSLLTPERQADLVRTAREVYTPEQIAAFKASYEKRYNGPVSEEYTLNEVVAENFSQLFRNTPISELTTPPRLLEKIGRNITDFAENLGLDLTAGVRTESGLPSSLRFNDVVRVAAQEVLTPRPPKVVEPVVRPRTVSLGEAAQILASDVEPRIQRQEFSRPVLPGKKATAAPTEAARTIAQEAPDTILPGAMASQREILGRVADSIASKEGVRYNYRSAPEVPGAAEEAVRTVRRAEIETARNMPEDVRRMTETTGFPYGIEKSKNGVIQILDWSPDMLASNALRWSKALSDLAVKDPNNAALQKVKYELDVQNGEWTEQGWRDIFKDAEVFSANQLAGFAGSGTSLEVPKVTGRYAPPEVGAPIGLDQSLADFQNLLYNIRVPKSPRQGKAVPGNLAAQAISEATLPGRLREPALVEPKMTKRPPFKGGEEIRDPNPLRAELETALQANKIPLPDGIEVVRRLNLEHIADVVSEPNLPRTAGGNIMTLEAGFQPAIQQRATERSWRVSGQIRGANKQITVNAPDIAAARKLAEAQNMRISRVENADKAISAQLAPRPVELADRVEKFTPEEFRAWAASPEGANNNFTGVAHDVGLQSPDRAFVDSLKQRYEATGKKMADLMAGLRSDPATMLAKLDDISALASQGQFFREAYEAATGTASAGLALRAADPNFKPPFPIEEAPKAQLAPPKAKTKEEVQKQLSDEVVRMAADYPEALPLEYQKKANGTFKLDKDGKPTPLAKNYDLRDTPLARAAAAGHETKAAKEAAIVDAYAEKIEGAYAEAAKNPAIIAGKDWYSLTRAKLHKLFGVDTKLFAEILGATSANTPVDTNFRFAIDAYNKFKAGDYNGIIAKYKEGKAIWDSGDLSVARALDTKNVLGEAPSRAAFRKFWIQHHDLKPKQSNGKLFGFNSGAVLRVFDGSWRAEIEGPKTPNFADNLSGDSFEATIDVWAARLMRRLGHGGAESPWRILAKNENRVSDLDFYMSQKAFRKAGDKLGVSPDALQAIVWFLEKDLWDTSGWTKEVGAKKSDFNAFLDITTRDADKLTINEVRTKAKADVTAQLAAPKRGPVVVEPKKAGAIIAMPQEDAEKIADAIYKAEGGARAKKPYGILSVKVTNKAEARRVALNTIKNNYKRWQEAGKPGGYLEFLAGKYAPLNVANDPKSLNKNWLKNVKSGLKNSSVVVK